MVSIIYSALNIGKKFKASLESIVNQTLKETEIIIIINSCINKDDLQRIEKYQEKFKNIQLFTIDDDKNLFYSRLYGAKKAKGDYLFFIDSTDYINTCYLEVVMKDVGDANIATTSFRRFKDNRQYSGLLYAKATLTGNKKFTNKEFAVFRLWNTIVKTSFFKQYIKSEDISEYNGTTLMIGLLAHCEKYYRYNEVLYFRGNKGTKEQLKEYDLNVSVEAILKCHEFNLPKRFYHNLLIDGLLVKESLKIIKLNKDISEINNVIKTVKENIKNLKLSILTMARPIAYRRAALAIVNGKYQKAIKILEKHDI